MIGLFPEAQQMFAVKSVYKGSRDGWQTEKFVERVFNKGSTLIIVKISNDMICGGFTSKSWDNSE